MTTAKGNSPWSEEIFVDLNNAIQSVESDTPMTKTGKTYMLDGRQVDSQNLRPGIYVRDGKKFLVR